MCGIVGSVNISHSLDLEVIGHRGPDDRGVYEDKNLRLGHVRLSIQDLSERGHQPFISQDGRYVIIFNGEIYNHWEIRETLEKKGYVFISTSDTETILIGFIEYGVDIIPKLNGIFAFCIYDKEAEKIIVARDRMGVKPLYFFKRGNAFGFASEMKALLKMYPDPSEIDREALVDYVRFLWSPGEKTPVVGITKLLQGRYIVIPINNVGKSRIIQYYKSGFSSSYIKDSEVEVVDKLDTLLCSAVERQLLSDVPVGFFLSGGLDSSLLVAMAKKINPERKLQGFTIETELEHKADTGDLFYAKQVAEYLGVELEIVTANVEIVKDFDSMIFHLDEPLADPAALNVLNISRRARKMGYKVLIGGTAGDDLFSGYRRHQLLRYEGYLNALPKSLRTLALLLSGGINTSHPRLRRLKKVLDSLSYDRQDRLFAYFEWLNNKAARSLFTGIEEGRTNADPFHYFRQLLAEIPDERDVLNQMLHLEQNTFLVDHNLNYTDKMGMAVGVEIRVPFLDNDVVDFSFRIPPELKMKGRETKYILKKVAERYLPKEVIYRQKTGFGAPVRKWITEDLQEMIDERLLSSKANQRSVFNPSAVVDLIKQNKTRKIDASYSIWALLAIESWCGQFLEKNVNGAGG